MAKRKRKKKQPRSKWWLPFLCEADQEVARGRLLYSAVWAENGDRICFESLMDARDISMELCKKLDPDRDGEKWLYHAAVFYGIGQLIREQIDFLEANPDIPEDFDD